MGDETTVLDCELPSLPVDPSRGGVRLICECQAKIAGSSLGTPNEILRGPSGGSYCMCTSTIRVNGTIHVSCGHKPL